MAVPPREPSLSREQRGVLALLANFPHGIAENLLALANGFDPATCPATTTRNAATSVGFPREAGAGVPHAGPARTGITGGAPSSGLNLHPSRPLLGRMAKRTEPPKPMIWNILKIADKAVFLGVIEAPDEHTAIERGAAEFKVPANRLMALRR
jgi:hypothetical protein